MASASSTTCGTPEDEDPRGVVVLSHGYAEHARRYDHVAKRLGEAGLVVYALDLRGHGRSGGKRVYLRDISEYADDFHTLVGIAAADYPELERVVLGHSMGGGVVFAYGVEHPDDYAAMVLSGPGGRRPGRRVAGDEVPSPRRSAGSRPACRSKNCPPTRCPATPRSSPPTRTTRWCITASCPPASAAALIGVGETMPQRAPALTAPLLVVHGEQDKLIPVKGSRRLMEFVGSRTPHLKVYPELYHEVFNEPEQALVLDDVTSWIETQM